MAPTDRCLGGNRTILSAQMGGKVDSRQTDLRRRLAATWPWLAAVSLATAMYFATFPAGLVFGPSIGFVAGVDQETFLTGLYYFLADTWRWPLLLVGNLAAPDGTVIVYTDSVPLFALLLRPFSGLIGPGANLLALWLALCYLLQGLAAPLALRLAGVRCGGALVLASVLALTLPCFVIRWPIPALNAQGLLLLALGLYFAVARQGRFRRVWPWFLALLAACLYVNPYLFVMAGLLFAATLLAALAQRQVRWPAAVAIGSLLVAQTLLLMWVGGFFHGLGGSARFGHFSMNLLSPIWPQRSTLLAFANRNLDATGGQREGINYLGAGLLLLVALALLSAGGWRERIRRHWPLAAMLAAAAAYSLSNRIYAGERLLLDLGLAPDWLQQFRATGRFFWPVGYALLLAVVLHFATGRGRRAGLPLLAAAAVLQLLDTAEMRRGFGDHLDHLTSATQRNYATWQPLIAAHDRLEILPEHLCTNPGHTRNFVTHLAYYAAHDATPTNTAYVARGDQRGCNRAWRSLAQRQLAEGTLLIVLDDDISLRRFALAPLGLVEGQRLCRRFKHRLVSGIACSRLWHAAALATPAEGFPPLAAAETAVDAFGQGTTLDLRQAPSAEWPVLLLGWRAANEHGSWGLNERSDLLLRVEPAEDDVVLALGGLALGPPPGGMQVLTILANDREIWRQDLRAPHQSLPGELRIARESIGADGWVDIAFVIDRPYRATEVLGNGDQAVLNVGLWSIGRRQ